MEFLERQIADLETQIAERMKPTPAEMAPTMQNASEDAPVPLSPRLFRASPTPVPLAVFRSYDAERVRNVRGQDLLRPCWS